MLIMRLEIIDYLFCFCCVQEEEDGGQVQT